MDSKIFMPNGLVRDDAWRYFKIERSQGVGKWKAYDRVVRLLDKQNHNSYGDGIEWSVESRTFACCGTAAFESLDGGYDCEEKAQEFLAIILAAMPHEGPDNWNNDWDNFGDAFMVDTTYSMSNPPENSFVKLLQNLGAKKVLEFPNRCHGPSTLEMWQWSPIDCVAELKHYLHTFKDVSPSGWGDRFRFIPMYLKEQFENEQREREDQASARTPAAAAPRVVVAAKAYQIVEWGHAGAVGVGDVRPVHGAELQQPHANQDHQNWVALNPNRNPAKRGV